jgi:predicted glycosyltransferase
LRTEVFSRKSISVLSYSWTQYLAVRGYFILATARQNSLVETALKAFGFPIKDFGNDKKGCHP